MKKVKKNNQELYIECLEFMCEKYALQVREMQKNIYWLLIYLQRNLKDENVERNDTNE